MVAPIRLGNGNDQGALNFNVDSQGHISSDRKGHITSVPVHCKFLPNWGPNGMTPRVPLPKREGRRSVHMNW